MPNHARLARLGCIVSTTFSTALPDCSRILLHLRKVACIPPYQLSIAFAGLTHRLVTANLSSTSRANRALQMREDRVSISRTLRILHFNDVYDIFSRQEEPVGGAARFVSALREHSLPETKTSSNLVVFSGDALSPSTLSHVTQGDQMPPVLGRRGANVAVAAIGNHDLDFGIEVFKRRMKECDFPWLCSNVSDIDRGEPLAGCKRYHVARYLDLTIGFIGIISHDWLEAINAIDLADVKFIDTVESASTLAKHLKTTEGCDMVVAVTHMRAPDDARLAENASDIDLILGGHDHIVDIDTQIRHRWVVKSGTDFRHFSTLDVSIDSDSSWEIQKPVLHLVNSSYAPDPEIGELVESYSKRLPALNNTAIGYTCVDLDGRFAAIRTSETTLGNFIADITAQALEAPIGIINSGSLRSDRVHPPGPVTSKDLSDILPFTDEAVAVLLTGGQILSALENSVSKYPQLDGRFCQVSGLRFTFDPLLPPGQRIGASNVYCRDGDEMTPLCLDRRYKTAVKTFMLMGKDGFDDLADDTNSKRIGDGMNVSAIISNYLHDVAYNDKIEAGTRNRRLSRRRLSQFLSQHSFAELKPSEDAFSFRGVYPKLDGRICCTYPDEKLQGEYKRKL